MFIYGLWWTNIYIARNYLSFSLYSLPLIYCEIGDDFIMMEDYRDGCRKAEDILHVLRDRVAQLPGTRDRKGRPVIVFPARESSSSMNPDHIRNILLYLHAVTA